MLRNYVNSDLKRVWGRQNLTNELEFSSIYPLRKYWGGNSTNVSCSKSENFLQIASTTQLDLDPSSAAYFLCNLVRSSVSLPLYTTLIEHIGLLVGINSCTNLLGIMLNVFHIYLTQSSITSIYYILIWQESKSK